MEFLESQVGLLVNGEEESLFKCSKNRQKPRKIEPSVVPSFTCFIMNWRDFLDMQVLIALVPDP